MNSTTRNAAMWFALVAFASGVVAIVAIIAGDLRASPGVGTVIAGVSLFVLLVGAFLAQYRQMTAGLLMLAGVFGVLLGQWSEISQWTVDLWTTATGGYVSYIDPAGVGHSPDFLGVLSGSAGMLGYAAALVTGTIGAVLAGFAPEAEPMPVLRPATASRAL